MNKIIHVHFIEPFEGMSDLYFGSVIAIYDVVPKEAVGITYHSLSYAIRGKSEYRNKKVVIRVGQLMRKSQSRTKDVRT